ncbi:hypothetical protein HC031_15660 [Planosporangium thailandense]|uniref:Glycosyltransferase RgtA/B/C/D-like domain-containing protein n=1 Tax=Planosporangium thailandense TaxID=765197 RepID=A0ABX0Y148_9ACTN|nr:hypothetical protein [Planosporangium thailandense]NJC71138.1 hypothetical protein [Planosporangium thailandense]
MSPDDGSTRLPRLRTAADRRTAWAITSCALVAAALRAPFIWTGIGMDEGGYAYAAWRWSQGHRPYRGVWLDRPQGLLLTYRFLLWLGDGGRTIRLAAVCAGAAITVLVGLIGWLLVGHRAGVAAAAGYAVVGVAPHLEGFTLNGELLASGPATAAVTAALLWRRSGSAGWLVVAGLAAGGAMTMKPSGVDGIVAGLAVVTGAVPRRPGRSRTAIFRAPVAAPTVFRAPVVAPTVFLAAVAAPLAACALHGWRLGWHTYWTAIAGYQLAAIGRPGSGIGARWHSFTGGLAPVGLDLPAIAVAAGAGLWLLRGSRPTRRTLLAWLASAAAGINLGGSYWPHYYVQLLPPLAVLAGVAIAAVHRTGWRAVAVAGTLLPQLIWFAVLVPATPAQRQRAIPYYAAARRDERIAATVRAETAPGNQIYVLVSEADIYFLSRRTTRYPYLWGRPIEKIPGALPRLRSILDGPGRPTLVLLYREPDTVDRTGEVRRILADRYRVERVIDGVVLLRSA